MKYIKRHMEQLILKLNGQYPSILITGPRQTGKTTMLKKLMNQESGDRNYVSLDDLEVRELARTDPKLFLQIHKPPVFIDEVQYAPELFTYIKIHIDENNNPGDFWLSGSQLYKLMDGVSESLAGRVAILHLSPLSQQEINGYEPTVFTVDMDGLIKRQKIVTIPDTTEIFDNIFKGGMPAVVSGKYEDTNIFYSGYLKTYLDKDVKDMYGVIDSLKFMRFVVSVAARCSQLINYQGIAEDCEINQATTKNWLRILEALGIIFYLHPYSNNTLKRTIKTPKLYFYDTGFVCYLTKWASSETAMNGAMNGALLENYTISEILKSYHNAGKEPYIYYYRDNNKKEIDLLIEQNGKLFPMEIKKTAMPDKRLTKVFSVIDKSSMDRGTGAVLCMADKLGAFDRDNLIVPIGLI